MKKRKIKDENIIREKILQAIEKSNNGINQKYLWKVLKIDSKIGTRVLVKLINEGKVSKSVSYVNGKKVYIISQPKHKLVILPIEQLEGLVCFPCSDIYKCSDEGELTPVNCPMLNSWLEQN